MLYVKPDYYKEFSCIADKCEDTCCAGWKIVIDKETLKKYRKISGPFKKRMRSSVNWLTGTFKQDKEKRCAFLNDKNLCDLYLAQGEDGFCHTCSSYPRHTEEFEGVREISLSVSCPEVARILMDRMAPVSFESYEDDVEEEYEDFDPFLFSVLEDARNVMIKILQDRSMSIRARAAAVLELAEEIQKRVDDGELFSCSELIDNYEFKAEIILVDSEETDKVLSDCAQSAFSLLYDLELLKKDWDILCRSTETILYSEDYLKYRNAFFKWKQTRAEIDIHLEQLLVYFLFTYFPGAVYDGKIFVKAIMAVYCVWMIEELWIARWLENGKSLERIEMTELVYRFSREVEHSDKNLKMLEEALDEP